MSPFLLYVLHGYIAVKWLNNSIDGDCRVFLQNRPCSICVPRYLILARNSLPRPTFYFPRFFIIFSFSKNFTSFREKIPPNKLCWWEASIPKVSAPETPWRPPYGTQNLCSVEKKTLYLRFYQMECLQPNSNAKLSYGKTDVSSVFLNRFARTVSRIFR